MQENQSTTAETRDSLSARQLAIMSGSVFDIPPRARRVLGAALVFGIVMVIVESLVGNRPETIPMDKVIHFLGYSTLAGTAVLALKPSRYIPAIVILFFLGCGIELLQSMTGRSMDWKDQMANTIGLLTGATVGIIIRTVYAYLSGELARQKARKKVYIYRPGETILAEGDEVENFCIIKSGEVEASIKVDGEERVLGRAGAGSVLGLLALVDGTHQVTTLRAVDRTYVYVMSLDELMETAGGHEVPIAMVLRDVTKTMRRMGKTLAENNLSLAD